MILTGMPPAEPQDILVQNNGFYPDLNAAELIENYAVATEYGNSQEMLQNTLRLAMIEVNQALAQYRLNHWSNYLQLIEVPSEIVDELSQLILLYKRAVFSAAKAQMLISKLGESHRDQQAAQQQQASDNQAYWANQSNDAIRQMTGASTTLSAALI